MDAPDGGGRQAAADGLLKALHMSGGHLFTQGPQGSGLLAGVCDLKGGPVTTALWKKVVY